ncbi:PEP-utilizing enzyme [Candidatus Poriferisocius sp.]|uniref:PEP-utilizing enzyme n=1 Tax=Candidatus Poriferisocius sp. TaxID=3101276 RepID=UPI003B5C0D07
MPVTAYEFDTSLDPDYPVLTRGNAGEIMPDIVSPLSATVFFPPLERGWRRSFTETWDVMAWPECPTTFAPIVGGRFYINISAFRRLADLTPGTSPEDIDRTLFAAGGIQLDPYVAPDEAGYAERGERIAAATADFLENPPVDRVATEHQAAQARRADGRAHRSERSTSELLDRFNSMIPFMESDFVTLFIGSSVSPVALGSLQAGLAEVYGDEGYEFGRQTVMGIGGIESADAAKAVAALAATDGPEFEAAFERVLEQYGFRGVNEWEIAAPSWEIRPDVLRRAVEAVRAGGTQRDPDATREAALARFETDNARAGFPDLDLWLDRCRVWMGIRERTKATCVLTINEMRLDALEIGRRLVADAHLEAADQVYFLTHEELQDAVAGGSVPLAGIEARRQAQAELEEYQEPLIAIAGEVPPVHQWPRKGADDMGPTDEIAGAAGSPGRATGRARVIMDAYADEPTQPGEVLVAPITDPGWMPLFVGAVAVVAEMGGELSHTMIVSRDLGIPAVVGAVGATTAISTGDLIEVDGSAGTVRILERA